MKEGETMGVGLAVVLILGGAILWFIYTYNDLSARQQEIDALWDETETHLKIRRDLIPALLERARVAVPAQDAILERIRALDEELSSEVEGFDGSRDADVEFERGENALSDALLDLQNAVRALGNSMLDEKFLELMGELVSIEGKAIAACERHNALVKDFNLSIRRFPASLVVGFLHFDSFEMRIFGYREAVAEAANRG
jgi:Uncharacterized conserved protein